MAKKRNRKSSSISQTESMFDTLRKGLFGGGGAGGRRRGAPVEESRPTWERGAPVEESRPTWERGKGDSPVDPNRSRGTSTPDGKPPVETSRTTSYGSAPEKEKPITQDAPPQGKSEASKAGFDASKEAQKEDYVTPYTGSSDEVIAAANERIKQTQQAYSGMGGPSPNQEDFAGHDIVTGGGSNITEEGQERLRESFERLDLYD